MTKNTKILLAVMLPILAFGALIVRMEYQIRTGERWVLSIEGYDPRDLLSGHYLLFRTQFNWKDKENLASCNYGQQCCVLLEENKGTNVDPIATVVDCKTHRKAAIVRGNRVGKTWFDMGLNRYYIPESHAKKLESLLRDKPCHVEVAVSNGGRSALITDLLIDGKSWRKYVDEP